MFIHYLNFFPENNKMITHPNVNLKFTNLLNDYHRSIPSISRTLDPGKNQKVESASTMFVCTSLIQLRFRTQRMWARHRLIVWNTFLHFKSHSLSLSCLSFSVGKFNWCQAGLLSSISLSFSTVRSALLPPIYLFACDSFHSIFCLSLLCS